MTYRINWWRHPDRRGQVFLPYTKMTRDMRIALPCNIAEPCGWAFRQNTGCHKASLLVGTIISMNYQYEELQLVELLRLGKAQSGTKQSKKEMAISRNQSRIQSCIEEDRINLQKVRSGISRSISSIPIFNSQSDNNVRIKSDKKFHRSDQNPPELFEEG